MMMSPFQYEKEIEDKSYKELLKEREELLKKIYSFENKKEDPNEIIMCPSPDVVYQMNLEYLSVLCVLIAKKYNKEYIMNEE